MSSIFRYGDSLRGNQRDWVVMYIRPAKYGEANGPMFWGVSVARKPSAQSGRVGDIALFPVGNWRLR